LEFEEELEEGDAELMVTFFESALFTLCDFFLFSLAFLAFGIFAFDPYDLSSLDKEAFD